MRLDTPVSLTSVFFLRYRVLRIPPPLGKEGFSESLSTKLPSRPNLACIPKILLRRRRNYVAGNQLDVRKPRRPEY